MTSREFNRIVLCFAGLVIAPAGILFAQQTEAQRSPAEQPNAKAQYRVEYFQPDGKIVRPVETLDSPNAWRIAAVTYGNQLGVEIAELDEALRAQLGIDEGTGVLVTGIRQENEAAKSLLARHDVILKIDDQAISGTKQFNDLIGSLQGKSAQFHVLRKGKPQEVLVTLPKSPVYELATRFTDITTLPMVSSVLMGGVRHYRIGVTLAEADDVLRNQLRLAAGEGLVVTEVLADSPAAKAGILRHDVLTKLDGKRLTAVEAANAQIQEIKDRAVQIALYRAGSEVVITVTPQLTDEIPYRMTLATSLSGLVAPREAWEAVQLRNFNVEVVSPDPTARPTAAVQLAELKKQLAELQKALEALEASLQSESANKPQPPAEAK